MNNALKFIHFHLIKHLMNVREKGLQGNNKENYYSGNENKKKEGKG